MLSFIFCDSMRCFWVCSFSIVCLCISIGDPVIESEGLGSINRFNTATFLCLSNPVPGFPTSRVVVFFVFSEKVRCDCSFCWYWWNCFYDRHHGFVNRNTCVSNDHGYVPLVVNTFRSFPHSWLIIGLVTRITLRVPLVEQELSTLPEHPSSPPVFPVFSVVRVFLLDL